MILPKIFPTSHLSHFSFLKSPKGFTLIELLIVIAMIVILISVGFASFTRAQKNARDTQRKQDINQVKIALEQYFEINKSYPTASVNGEIVCGSALTWGTSSFTCVGQTYMRVLPDDPSGSASYPEYCYETAGSGFNLFAKMEGNNGNLPGTESCSGENYDYKLIDG